MLTFCSLLANCCYKVYENPEITQAKMKPVRDAAAQILAVLVNRYNHGMIFIPKCVQVLFFFFFHLLCMSLLFY